MYEGGFFFAVPTKENKGGKSGNFFESRQQTKQLYNSSPMENQ
jgi:hypothetical protein